MIPRAAILAATAVAALTTGTANGASPVRGHAVAPLASSTQLPATPALIATGLGSLWNAGQRPDTMTFLDNGLVRVGVDLDLGGVITHVSPTGGGSEANLVNEHDTGREVQQSYYSGGDSGTPCPGWIGNWNPVGAGDCNGDRSTVLTYSNDGTTIYVKSRPLLRPVLHVPCECTFEQWITLAGRAVQVRNRLVNDRADKAQYFARWQELPLFFSVGRLGHLFTYVGSSPYSGGALTEISAELPNAAQFRATEQWAANVDGTGSGLGIVSPEVQTFLGGFWGTRGVGGPYDDSAGYIAPVRPEVLDWNISYDYSYALVVGTLAQIRDYAVAHRPDTRPDYHFSTDRQGWWFVNATDSGAPITGPLHVLLDLEDPQMLGPDTFWNAEDVPKLYIRAAYHSSQNHAELLWRAPWEDYDGSRRVEFAFKNDGAFHTYAIDLAGPGYAGPIGSIRFDPVLRGEGGATVDVDYISWKPEPRTLSITAQGQGSVVSLPAGISCPPTCTASFPDTTEVILTANHAPGFAFAGWGGCELQEPTCDITIDGDAALTALFVPGIHRRTVSLSFRSRLALGRLRVADHQGQCLAGSRVRLERRSGHGWTLFAAGRTNRSGSYAIRVGSRHGVYRATVRAERFGFGHVCTATKSPPRRR